MLYEAEKVALLSVASDRGNVNIKGFESNAIKCLFSESEKGFRVEMTLSVNNRSPILDIIF